MNKTFFLIRYLRLILRYSNLFFNLLRLWFQTTLFGFVQGHKHFPKKLINEIQRDFGSTQTNMIHLFEREFAKLIGDGEAISFAAGRMGFFALMKLLKIGEGNEVILLGSTCSVMVNAVLRTGAKPIFSDIDPDNFGSSALSIQKCLSLKTRMIVAQHSFGIPCEIESIVCLARDHKIFLLEDCAIALGSTIDGVPVGNFGDAALFSTDHSKPINILAGGLIYTRDKTLLTGLRQAQADAGELPQNKQRAMLRQFLRERKYCQPSKYSRLAVINLFLKLGDKFLDRTSPFLDDDYMTLPGTNYPYPAKLPNFLAKVGLYEVDRWIKVANERKALLSDLLTVAKKSEVKIHLPKAYFNTRLEIVPLRFVWTQPDGWTMRKRLSKFIDVEWTWFMKPIIATTELLERFGYFYGTCPLAERIGPNMVNLPCNLSSQDGKKLVNKFERKLMNL